MQAADGRNAATIGVWRGLYKGCGRRPVDRCGLSWPVWCLLPGLACPSFSSAHDSASWCWWFWRRLTGFPARGISRSCPTIYPKGGPQPRSGRGTPLSYRCGFPCSLLRCCLINEERHRISANFAMTAHRQGQKLRGMDSNKLPCLWCITIISSTENPFLKLTLNTRGS